MFSKLFKKPLLRYLAVGVTTYILELAALLVFYKLLDLSASLATGIAFWIGLATSFVLQKTFAFKDYQKTTRVLSHQLGSYITLVLFNYIFTLVFVSVLPEEKIVISRTIALVLTTGWNFFIYKKIFKENHTFIGKNTLGKIGNHTVSLFSVPQSRSRVFIGLACTVLLVAATAFGSVNASYSMANDSDALVNTYLLKDGYSNAHINLQPEHTNMLKFPIFSVSAHFPYTYKSFVLLNTFLSLVAVLGWFYLLIKMLGSRSMPVIALLMSILIVGSTSLNLQFVWTTIRNIEFPIALLFILLSAKLLSRKGKITKLIAVKIAAATGLYSLLLASDIYFLYIISVPILLLAIWDQIRAERKFRVELTILYSCLAISAVIGLTLPILLEKLGIISVHPSGSFARTIVGYDIFFRSIEVALRQLFDLGGGMIFSQPTKIGAAGVFLNFGLILVAIVSGLALIRNYFRSDYKFSDPKAFGRIALTLVALIFFWVFAVYILSGQVIQTTSDGKSISELQQRYITFMIFLAMPLMYWGVTRLTKNHTMRIALIFVLLAGLTVNAYHARNEWRSIEYAATAKRTLFIRTADILRAEGIDVALTGHWFGATTRFWSHDNVKHVPVQNCDKPFLVLSRPSWYTPKPNTQGALVVDHTGPDSYFWMSCTEKDLQKIYGTPRKKTVIGPGQTIWIYDYDLRTKLNPNFPTH